MNDTRDIRWQQRFSNYQKAFNQLERFLKNVNLNEMEEQGLIKAFEYSYELGWKTLQDLLKHKGYKDIAGPKPVIRKSFQDGYINDGKAWMRMHNSRNLTSHTYDDQAAKETLVAIRTEYYQLFKDLLVRLENEKSDQLNEPIDDYL